MSAQRGWMSRIMTFVEPETGQDIEVWDGRASLRTLADALAKLHEFGVLAADGQAAIRTIPLGLPDGSIADIVEVIARRAKPPRSIMMPASSAFTARDTLGAQHRYKIDKLNGAITDVDGNVRLS